MTKTTKAGSMEVGRTEEAAAVDEFLDANHNSILAPSHRRYDVEVEVQDGDRFHKGARVSTLEG